MSFPTPVMDELQQKVDWRARLIVDVIKQRFDEETLVAMLDAGLSQAHSEGLKDAAYICEQCALDVADPIKRHTAKVLASAILELDRRNITSNAK